MRLKIALLCALLVPLGTAKADVVALSNTAATTSGSTSSAGSLFIKFTTSGSGGFQLTNLTLFGVTGDTGVAYSLKNSFNTVIASGSGTTSGSGVLTFDSNYFGAETYRLEISGLDAGYTLKNSANLTGGAFNVTDGLLITSFSDDSAPSSLYQASLTVTVPEPATMILTGSALAVGAIGAYFKRRRKSQTEIAA